MIFQHHPDKMICVGDFIYSLDEFLIDEPNYTLRSDCIGRIYEQNVRHCSFTKDTSYGEPFPWAEGDMYLSKVDVYRAAYELRHPEPSPPSPPPVDYSDLNTAEKSLRALASCVAQIGSLTEDQMKILFKQKWDAL